MTFPEQVDLLVVGGGINGCGIARDAVGRGLSVVVCERDDLARATSSASTKLIHGGLRYLEYYAFRLVRKALSEREVMLQLAPHIIWPLRFVMPHSADLRPAWMIRAGLFLYDHLGGRRRLPGSTRIALRDRIEGAPLQPCYRTGFVYSDCWVDDARLVVLNAMDAHSRGVHIAVRTAFAGATPDGNAWQAQLQDTISGEVHNLRVGAIVNAAGPWVADVAGRQLGGNATARVKLVKGSHIIVPRLFAGDHAYILQNDDKRVVFAIPYESDFTLIGTTDVPVDADAAGDPAITEDEIAYLIAAVNRYLLTPVTREQVVWTYSGVRPLYDDGETDPSAITRDYVLDVQRRDGATALNVYGGKITTYRRLAEHALERLRPALPHMGRSWTADAALPGGDIANADFTAFRQTLSARYPALPARLLDGLARRHGSLVDRVLDGVVSAADLGRDFGGGLCEREVRYLIAHEWARAADDVLWRRTKAGLHMTAEQRAVFADWFAQAI